MDPRTSRAAILVRSREPLVVDEISLPDQLDAGQVLVRVRYSTICGAQLNEIAAAKGPDKFLPHLLGHEATAEVLEVGPGVAHVQPGASVILHWRPSRGIQSQPPAYVWQGQTLNAGWVTTFNEHAVVSENRLTPLPPGLDPKLAPLFGCAVTTAAGVVGNDAQVRVGESVVVFGVGGVGLNVVQFAHLAGAYPIVAVDLFANKLEWARQRGATHAVDGSSASADDAIREIVGSAGADKVVETTGSVRVIERAYELTGAEGTCVLVGVPSEKATIYTLPLHFTKVLTGSHGGGAAPHVDIPRLARLVEAGRLPLDGLISHEFPLAGINDALEVVRAGDAGRVLIDMTR
jgi:S-(hydroxymethyl)glutathione dehydrogenase/alcohol dehydrogenase